MTGCQHLWNISSLVFSSYTVCFKRFFPVENKLFYDFHGMNVDFFFFSFLTRSHLLVPQDNFKSWFSKMLFYIYFLQACFLLSDAILFKTYHAICLVRLIMRRQSETLLSTLSTFRNVHFAYWFFEARHFLICKAGRVHSFRCLSVTAIPF